MIHTVKCLFTGLLLGQAQPQPGLAQTPLASLEGHVIDARTKQPVPDASLTIWVTGGKQPQRQHTHPDGSFQVQVSAKQTYRIVTEATGYLPTEAQIAFTDSRSNRLYGKIIQLTRADPTPPVVAEKKANVRPIPELAVAKRTSSDALPMVPFRQGTTQLEPEAQSALDRLVTYLSQHAQTRVTVYGHTDNQGDFDQNIQLSRQRAELVKAYLVDHGIAPDRLQTRGYGGTHPIASNNHEETRQLNRRVEVVVN